MSSVTQQCDVCGQDVPADDMVKHELTVAGAMCPTAMTFHRACFEQASAMWEPDPDSYCTVDPLFPETGQWVVPEDARAGAAPRAGQPAGAAPRAGQPAGAAPRAGQPAGGAPGAEERATR